jgi:hypothetical protein
MEAAKLVKVTLFVKRNTPDKLLSSCLSLIKMVIANNKNYKIQSFLETALIYLADDCELSQDEIIKLLEISRKQSHIE